MRNFGKISHSKEGTQPPQTPIFKSVGSAATPYVSRNSSTFENSDTGYKARVKNNRRRAFCTLRIFSSGRDAAGYIRSDVSASLKLAAKSVQGCTLLAMQRRRRYHYFQKTLHFAIFAPILMVMLSQRILLPQYQLSPPKAQIPAYFQKVVDIHSFVGIITQQLSNSATQQLSNSATQQLSNSGVEANYGLINGQLFHSDNNIIIFSHTFLQTVNVLLIFSLLNRKEYHVCGEK